MFSITHETLPVFSLFESAFTTTATFVRAKLLGVAAILTVLPQSEREFAFAGVRGNTLAEEHL
jgi:hypothetical protein